MTPKRLSELNGVLKEFPALKVVLVVDGGLQPVVGVLQNLDVLPLIPSVRRLAVLSNSSTPLTSLGQLSGVDSLLEFSLGGFLDSKIDLAPLARHRDLESLALELKLPKKGCRIIDGMVDLRSLSVESVNPADLTCPNLQSLKLTKPGNGLESIPEKFPTLRELFLQKVPKSASLTFLTLLTSLEKVTINYTPSLVELPDFGHHAQLRYVELLEARNLSSLEPLCSVKSMETLCLTGANHLSPNSCTCLRKLPQLRDVYTAFSNSALEKLFSEMAEECGWITRHPSVLVR